MNCAPTSTLYDQGCSSEQDTDNPVLLKPASQETDLTYQPAGGELRKTEQSEDHHQSKEGVGPTAGGRGSLWHPEHTKVMFLYSFPYLLWFSPAAPCHSRQSIGTWPVGHYCLPRSNLHLFIELQVKIHPWFYLGLGCVW